MSDNDLRKRIAERLGWRFERLHEDAPAMGVWFAVYDPTGAPRLRDTAYQAANEWPEYDLGEAYPDWPADANAALALLTGLETDFDLTYYPDIKWFAEISAENGACHRGQGLTPAEAICLAWLAYMEAQDGK